MFDLSLVLGPYPQTVNSSETKIVASQRVRSQIQLFDPEVLTSWY